MDPSLIWRDYANLALLPILIGTALMILARLAREVVARWFYD